MKFNKNNTIQIILGLVFVCLLIFIIHYVYTSSNMSSNSKKKGTKSIKCGANGCPINQKQNDFYRLHEFYKANRTKNDALTKSSGGSFFKQSSNKGPKNVFIIRHGEKIDAKFSLDCNGILRSTYIPVLVEELNHKGYGINAIISINNYTTMHEQQTVMLTSWLLDIPLFIYGEQNNQQITIETLFKNPYYDGKNVLICWEHTCIQELIKQIINIAPKVKGLTGYKFINPDGNSGLPNWDFYNYQSVLHFDEQLNFEAFSEPFTTCYAKDNDTLVYGVSQVCGSVPSYSSVKY